MFYLFILSILPIILIGLYYYQKDTKKEPKKLLRKLFLSGIFSAIMVIIISIIALIFFPMFAESKNLNVINTFIYCFIFVALTEELCKWLMIYKISYNHKDFDQMYDIILYSVFVGLGFACLENILYVIPSENGTWIALFRGITAIPVHACLQTLMGYYLYLSKYEKNKKYLYYSIIIPVILHGTYDFILIAGNKIFTNSFSLIFIVVFLIILFVISFLKVRKLVKKDKNNLDNSICPNCKTLIKGNFCTNCGHKK